MSLLKSLGIAVLSAGIGYGIAKALEERPQYTAMLEDANNDGLPDLVLHDDGRGIINSVFIQRRQDGLFVETDVVMNDGILFFVTNDGFYDPWGTFHDNQTIEPVMEDYCPQ